MKTNIPDVFAAGDVVSFPLPLVGHKRVNIGHWQLAQAHGTTWYNNSSLNVGLSRYIAKEMIAIIDIIVILKTILCHWIYNHNVTA